MCLHAFHIGNIFFCFFILTSACNNERWDLLFGMQFSELFISNFKYSIRAMVCKLQ